jgi:hypothetical protein
MKKLAFILCLIFIALAVCRAQTLTNVVFGTVGDYGLSPQRKVNVTLTLVSPNPRTINNIPIRQDPVATTTDTNGWFAFTNIQWGSYTYALSGQFGTVFKMQIYTNDNGSIPIASRTITVAVAQPNPASNYYTMSQADARFALAGSGGGLTTNQTYLLTNAMQQGATILPSSITLGGSNVTTWAQLGGGLPSWFDGSGTGYNGSAAFSLDSSGNNDNSVSIGNGANGSNYGAAVGSDVNGSNYGAAVGSDVNGSYEGAAVGSGANGSYVGAAVGCYSDGSNYGASVGYGANSSDYGAAVGYGANGCNDGAAVGRGVNGSGDGAAVGFGANGYNYGIAVGSSANGYGLGNIALGGNDGSGANADATGGGTFTDTCEIGRGAATVNGALHYRGNVLMDGSGNLYGNDASFESGGMVVQNDTAGNGGATIMLKAQDDGTPLYIHVKNNGGVPTITVTASP